jgi:Flp pilus assembly protein CpaB
LVNMQEAITTARQRRPFTILGMLIALITLGAFIFVATRPGGGGPVITGTGNAADVSVVVAKSDIAARATLTSDMLTVAKLNSKDVPPQSFSALADIAGSSKAHFALIDIKAGQPVLANELVTSATDLAGAQPSFLDIPQGFVAFTIPTSEEQGVAGYIQPGDYIGIIATVDKGATTTSKTIFNNVHVIRVGTATTTITPGRNGPTATRVASGGSSSLTVVMNQCEAEYLTWFLAKTNLRYTLENFQDYGKGSANNPQQAAACPIDTAQGVTNADVIKRYGSTLVP